MPSTIYLIPTILSEGIPDTIPSYILQAVQRCNVFFVENERSARRFLKSIWKEMVIDDYKWYTIHKAEESVKKSFLTHIRSNENIGILSEAGCPGIADPGQLLIQTAHAAGATVKPLVGPSAILLSLMASGLNGQQFQFVGYLPVGDQDRQRSLRLLETESSKKNCTQLFIETPYRNNQMLESLLKTCNGETMLCIACELTGSGEWVKTKSIANWKMEVPDLHKKQVVFLMLAGGGISN